MKPTHVLILAVAFVLAGIAPSFAQAENPSNYLMFKGGLYAPSEDFDLGGAHFDSDDGFALEAAFGHYFLPFLAIEFGGGYFQSEASPATTPGESKLKVVPVLLTGKVLLPLGIVEPYAEIGGGVYVTEFEINGDDTTKGVLGVHAGGGVNFNLGPNVFIGAEGKYLWAEESFGGQDIRLDGFFAMGTLGFRY